MRDRRNDYTAYVVQWTSIAIAVWALMYFASSGSAAHRATSAAWTAIPAAAAGFGFTMISRRRQRAPFGLDRDAWRQIDRAMRTGVPPQDPSLDFALLQTIDARRRQLERDRSWEPWMYGLFAVISIVMGFFQPFYFVLAAICVLVTVTNHRTVNRSHSRLDRLVESCQRSASL